MYGDDEFGGNKFDCNQFDPIWSDVPRFDDAWFETAAMPTPTQLATLGSLLWLFPPESRHPLDRWAYVVRAEAYVAIDDDGVREWIAFFDADDGCRCRAYLLPDSDFVAWECLNLPLSCGPHRTEAMTLCQRLSMRGSRSRWRAMVLRLRAVARSRTWTLHAYATPLSALGLQVANAIVRAEDADVMLAPLRVGLGSPTAAARKVVPFRIPCP
jgi:hypothetical protein